MHADSVSSPRAPSIAAAVWLLGLTQNVGYGTLYYAMAILAADMGASFGVSSAWIFGALSAALLAGGLAAPVAGRRIDRHGAGTVMAIGSVLAAAAMAALAAAPNLAAFVAALIAVEVVSTVVQYDAAFAGLVQLAGSEARRRITHLTLIAGFASTLFWPLTTWLHGFLDWRAVVALYAAMNLVLCAPAHLVLARMLARAGDGVSANARESGSPPPAAGLGLDPETARRVLLLVTFGFALGGFMLSGVLAQLVPLLGAVGLGGSAVLVGTLFGPSQVLVRLVNMLFGAGRHPLTLTLFSVAMLTAAAVVLAATAPNVAGAALFAVMLGFGSGLTSIVRGTLPLALFGSASYGERLGRMAMVRLAFTSVAPFVLALLMEAWGSTAALLAMASTGLLAIAAFVAAGRLAMTRG
ncbi:arsenite efflux MFS transporter ArsK [Prosthecomicrobium sp. N25]|uniref:arsenite efflux MFS transporter ArsK n=1 Tax=Prosthecomicrobium sp. N25 TaxID=3129254 RepID=UPI00307778D1